MLPDAAGYFTSSHSFGWAKTALSYCGSFFAPTYPADPGASTEIPADPCGPCGLGCCSELWWLWRPKIAGLNEASQLIDPEDLMDRCQRNVLEDPNNHGNHGLLMRIPITEYCNPQQIGWQKPYTHHQRTVLCETVLFSDGQLQHMEGMVEPWVW